MSILVRSAGFLTSIQDLGRTGYRQSGISSGGALDSHALRVANALVGNDDNAAGLELTFGRVRLRFEDDRMVAWGGGAFSAQIGDARIPPGHCGFVAKGDELTVVAPDSGGRAWLAISGGIDVPLVLASGSTDLRGNFGGHEGRALREGDELPLSKERRFTNPRNKGGGLESALPWGAPATWASIVSKNTVLRIVHGTDWKRFTTGAQGSLLSGAFTVMPDSDRMGVRLDGPSLERMDAGDLTSEAVAPGTIQVPPSGKPILLLGDCQTIGGYPKIAHVITVDLPMTAQLWPGAAVRFQEVSLSEAQELLREREEDFARFRLGLRLHQA
jgi:antagonist of KipI